MKHGTRKRRFDRSQGHRKAMLRNLTRSLVVHEGIRTTEARAKEIRAHVDRLITLGKKGDLHSRRQALARLPDRRVIDKIFGDLSERFKERNGGFTRIYSLAPLADRLRHPWQRYQGGEKCDALGSNKEPIAHCDLEFDIHIRGSRHRVSDRNYSNIEPHC